MALELTTETFQTTITDNSLVLVDFWAPWCGPCRMMSPVIDQLSTEVDFAVISKVNSDEYPSLTTDQNVRALPTIVIYKDGVEVERIVGASSKQNLESLLNSHK